MCVCVSGCVCVCVGVHICGHAHVWMLEINVGYLIFLDHSLLHFLRQCLSLNLELTDATKLDGQRATEIACPGSVFCLCLPRVGVIDAHLPWPFSLFHLLMGAGNYTQVLMFVWQACYQPASHLPSSMYNI